MLTVLSWDPVTRVLFLQESKHYSRRRIFIQSYNGARLALLFYINEVDLEYRTKSPEHRCRRLK